MPKKRKAYICQLGHDDEEKALEFELEFQKSLTIDERFEMMFETSNRIKEMLIRYGHRKPTEIIQRS